MAANMQQIVQDAAERAADDKLFPGSVSISADGLFKVVSTLEEVAHQGTTLDPVLVRLIVRQMPGDTTLTRGEDAAPISNMPVSLGVEGWFDIGSTTLAKQEVYCTTCVNTKQYEALDVATRPAHFQVGDVRRSYSIGATLEAPWRTSSMADATLTAAPIAGDCTAGDSSDVYSDSDSGSDTADDDTAAFIDIDFKPLVGSVRHIGRFGKAKVWVAAYNSDSDEEAGHGAEGNTFAFSGRDVLKDCFEKDTVDLDSSTPTSATATDGFFGADTRGRIFTYPSYLDSEIIEYDEQEESGGADIFTFRVGEYVVVRTSKWKPDDTPADDKCEYFIGKITAKDPAKPGWFSVVDAADMLSTALYVNSVHYIVPLRSPLGASLMPGDRCIARFGDTTALYPATVCDCMQHAVAHEDTRFMNVRFDDDDVGDDGVLVCRPVLKSRVAPLTVLPMEDPTAEIRRAAAAAAAAAAVTKAEIEADEAAKCHKYSGLYDADDINNTANTSLASEFEFEFCGDDYESPDSLFSDAADKFVLGKLSNEEADLFPDEPDGFELPESA